VTEDLADQPAPEAVEATSEVPTGPADGSADEPPASTAEPLLTPRDGVPEPLTTPAELAAAIEALSAGSGPLAVDAERASGYRYSQRAYLVQLRREGAGTILIDPIALPDLTALGEAMKDVEWIIHAAHQDLPCLAPLGLSPSILFDTELAGRLLGEHRVALGTMIEERLGFHLEKGHSAADWSTRPLPHEWLVYAALDVELLVDLRDAMAAELAAAGKTEWAAQEFAAELTAPAPPPRREPWRRTSGIHALRKPRQLAEIRALWESRNALAIERDIAPGRVLPDAAIVAAVRSHPADEDALLKLSVFGGRNQRRLIGRWFAALTEARNLPDSQLPKATAEADGPPVPSRWRDRDPIAALRLSAVREVIATLGAQHSVEIQNLLAADLVRRIAWEPPGALDAESVAQWLRERGAREWQIELVAADVSAALASSRRPEAVDEGAGDDPD
jgi:ribonuclease D